MAKAKAADTNQTKEAKVAGVIVTISQPYTEGHVITANEAKALNQTRTENIQNNTRTAVKKYLEENGLTEDSLTDDALEAIQNIVSDYDADYEFAVRTASASIVDPREREARKLVREEIKVALRSQEPPVKISEVDPAAIDAKIDSVLASADGEIFWKTADDNLAAKARVASAQLGSLEL
jgi:hypothetical protein